MISRQLLKEVVATNLTYIVEKVRPVVGRERIARRAVEREGDRVAVAGSSSAISPTDDQEEDIEQGGVKISVRATWRWMLET
jgi:hypothetical protein